MLHSSGTGTVLCFNPPTWISPGSGGKSGCKTLQQNNTDRGGTRHGPEAGLEERLSAEAVSDSHDSEGRKQSSHIPGISTHFLPFSLQKKAQFWGCK